MLPERAREIVEVARKHGGIKEGAAVPAEESELVQLAGQLVQLAEQSKKATPDAPLVKEILALRDAAENDVPESQPEPEDQSVEPDEEAPEAEEPAAEPVEPEVDDSTMVNDDVSSFLKRVRETSNREIKSLGIEQPVLPEEFHGKEMPFVADITKLSDDEWRRLHWERHAMDVYTSACATDAEEEADAYERLAANRLGETMWHLEQLDLNATPRVDRTAASRKAEAQGDAEYKYLDEVARTKRRTANKLRELAQGFEKDVTRLSREWTARHGARDAAGELHGGR